MPRFTIVSQGFFSVSTKVAQVVSRFLRRNSDAIVSWFAASELASFQASNVQLFELR
jgi:hypothetical protein